jgi:hypothetical protein
MASDEKKAEYRRLQEVNLFKARGAELTASETDTFKCNKCGKSKTSYYQMQTRSADEPMTVRLLCVQVSIAFTHLDYSADLRYLYNLRKPLEILTWIYTLKIMRLRSIQRLLIVLLYYGNMLQY